MAQESAFYRALAKDALWRREWIAMTRLARTPWLLLLTGLGATTFMMLMAAQESGHLAYEAGRALYGRYFALATGLVLLAGPALAASTVAMEREGRTWEALVMAGVRPRTIDRGKFAAAFTHLALYILALVPAGAVPLLFGGVTLAEVVAGFALLVVAGALSVRFGLVLSAALPSTRTALLGTVLASAAVAGFVGTLSFAMSRWLDGDLSVPLRDVGPAFLPVALFEARLGWDYARYLVVAPMVGIGVAWFVLRELTVSALSAPHVDRRAPLRRLFLVASPVLAVVMGLLPRGDSSLVALLVTFFLWAAGGVFVLTGPDGPGLRTPREMLVSSALVMCLGTAGLLALSFIGRAVASPYSYGDLTTAEAITFYGPAVLVLSTGITAQLETRCSPGRARFVFLGVAIAWALLPLALGAGLWIWFATDARHLVALSPLWVFEPRGEAGPLAAGLYTTLGAALLALAVRRRRIQIAG